MEIRSVTEITDFRTKWEELPASIQSQFSEAEKAAYSTGAIYFKQLARQCAEPSVMSLFELLDDDHPMRVYVESKNNGLSMVWFEFSCHTLLQQPQFRVGGSQNILPQLPPRLTRLYRYFGGIRFREEHDGGILPPELMRPLNDYECCGMRSRQPVELTQWFTVLSFGNGDYICSNAEGVAMFHDHERNELTECDLDAALDLFLQDLLKEEPPFGFA